jgi:monooxygenase
VVDGAGAVDGRGGTDRHWRATALNLRLPDVDVVYQLLPDDEGYAAKFPGMERFPGRIVHPQHWPEDLDYAGKQVVVIGSGATAVTLVPAMAQRAALVTMLQRSPSYVLSLPARDPVADRLRRVLPAKVAYWLIRWKNVLLAMLIFQISRRQPQRMKALIRKGLKKRLPEGYDTDTHFSPRYNPWDQRLCLVPDGDLFAAIRRGRASIATGDIDTSTETGVALSSGTALSADVIVTATGLNMLALGGMEIVVDGCRVDLGKTVSYQGVMFSGIPNLAAVTGYTNASWTLKCELICTYVCRLLQHMDSHGYRQVRPRWPQPELPTRPFVDLAAGYVRRSVNDFPRQGPTAPWRIYQNCLRDVWLFKYSSSITDDALQFSGARAGVPQRPTEQAYASGRTLGTVIALAAKTHADMLPLQEQPGDELDVRRRSASGNVPVTLRLTSAQRQLLDDLAAGYHVTRSAVVVAALTAASTGDLR